MKHVASRHLFSSFARRVTFAASVLSLIAGLHAQAPSGTIEGRVLTLLAANTSRTPG